MATIVCKQFSFDSSHQLVGHKGKCANLHGHTYKLEVFVKGNVIDEPGTSDDGFVIDFSDLKDIVKEHIVDPIDHAFIAKGDEPALKLLVETGSKVFYLQGIRSTCENMCEYIYWKLSHHIPNLYAIRLWETPTGYAQFGGVI